MFATLLIVTVFSAGGPALLPSHPDGPPRTRVAPFRGVTVVVSYPSGRVATLKTDRHGRVYLRVAPGTYRIQGEMRPPISNPRAPCEARLVMARGRLVRTRVYCSIK